MSVLVFLEQNSQHSVRVFWRELAGQDKFTGDLLCKGRKVVSVYIQDDAPCNGHREAVIGTSEPEHNHT